MKYFGQALKEIREEADVTQSEMARRLECTPSAVNQLEARENVSEETAKAYARALDLKVSLQFEVDEKDRLASAIYRAVGEYLRNGGNDKRNRKRFHHELAQRRKEEDWIPWLAERHPELTSARAVRRALREDPVRVRWLFLLAAGVAVR